MKRLSRAEAVTRYMSDRPVYVVLSRAGFHGFYATGAGANRVGSALGGPYEAYPVNPESVPA